MSEVLTNDLHKQPETDRDYGFSFSGLLYPGQTVTGGSVLEVIGPDASLTVGAPSPNGSVFEDPDNVTTIPANEGLVAQLSGGTAGRDYYVRIQGDFANPAGSDVLTTRVRVRTR